MAAYWSKIATPLYLAPPLGVTPPDLHNDSWWRKTRMMGLSDSEGISMICSAVLIQYTRVTDGRTDRQTDRRTDGIGVAYTRYSMLSRVKTAFPIDVHRALTTVSAIPSLLHCDRICFCMNIREPTRAENGTTSRADVIRNGSGMK